MLKQQALTVSSVVESTLDCKLHHTCRLWFYSTYILLFSVIVKSLKRQYRLGMPTVHQPELGRLEGYSIMHLFKKHVDLSVLSVVFPNMKYKKEVYVLYVWKNETLIEYGYILQSLVQLPNASAGHSLLWGLRSVPQPPPCRNVDFLASVIRKDGGK